MFSFWKRRTPDIGASAEAQLQAIVDAHMPDADEATVQLVTAVAGLLAGVAYADRKYEPSERAHIDDALRSVHGLSAQGVQTILDLLDREIVMLASANPQAYTRDLRELATLETRREILQLLVDLAAADGSITTDETNMLRRTTTAMGLEHDDYVQAQAPHRDRLSVLSPNDD